MKSTYVHAEKVYNTIIKVIISRAQQHKGLDNGPNIV
jgi:hypothetical protein